jgi:hypothetical protein
MFCGRRTSAAFSCVSSSMRAPARSAMPIASFQVRGFTVPVDIRQDVMVRGAMVQRAMVQRVMDQGPMDQDPMDQDLMDHAFLVQRANRARIIQMLRRPERRRLPAGKPRRTLCRHRPKRRRRGSVLRARCRRRRMHWVSRRDSHRPALRSVHRCPARGRQRSSPQSPFTIRWARHKTSISRELRSPMLPALRSWRRPNRHPLSRAKRPTFRLSMTSKS